MSQRCAQEVVDSGREAFGQRGLRERAGAFHAGGGPLRIPVSLHWSEHREDEGVEPARGHRPTPRSSPTPACLSSTPPSIRGSQVPAERGQAKAGREESETGATDAPPAGPPKLLNYRDEQEAGSRQTLGDPGQAFCRSGGFFLLFSHELCDLEQITVVLWASLCSLRNGNCIKKELLGCFSLKNKAKQQSQRGNGHRSSEAKRVQSWRGVLVLVFP